MQRLCKKAVKTGKPMSIYVVNPLPIAEFEQIYEIKQLCDIFVVIERFRGFNTVKPCMLSLPRLSTRVRIVPFLPKMRKMRK